LGFNGLSILARKVFGRMTDDPNACEPAVSSSEASTMVVRQHPADLARKPYDLVVVGGGVYGIMLTFEAARRGLRALLLERRDFGGETSRNSLRIVHGGLRYLQTLDFKRFREHVAERRWFMRHFPHLVTPLSCLMPLYGEGVFRVPFFRPILAFNDLLSSDRNKGVPPIAHLPGSRTISAAQVMQAFPAVRIEGLEGGIIWHDGFIPDVSRLFTAALGLADAGGADALNHVEAKDLVLEAGHVVGVEAVDCQTGEAVTFNTNIVINACGPWSQDFAERCGLDAQGLFAPTLAWNVVFNRPWNVDCAVAVRPQSKGARFYFLVPWEGKLLAGTGQAPWSGEADHVTLASEHLEAFIADLNRAVPGLALQRSEAETVMAGLLPVERPGSSALANREKIIDHGSKGGPEGVFSVSGVKLTTARLVAERVLGYAFPRAVVRDEMRRPGRKGL
jgi:glycerol-3-phosphate dehydrogenase